MLTCRVSLPHTSRGLKIWPFKYPVFGDLSFGFEVNITLFLDRLFEMQNEIYCNEAQSSVDL